MPTMNVSLTAEIAAFVEAEVSGGDYVSASEVVRDALRMMRREKELEETKLRLLRDELDRGFDEAGRGHSSGRTVDDIVDAVLAGRGR